MKMTKNIISRDEAVAICPEYVAFVEGDYDKFDVVSKNFESADKGAEAISAHEQNGVLTFFRGKISSVDRDSIRAIDGPVVRFGNGEFTWRVDGDKYAHVLTTKMGRRANKIARRAVETCLQNR